MLYPLQNVHFGNLVLSESDLAAQLILLKIYWIVRGAYVHTPKKTYNTFIFWEYMRNIKVCKIDVLKIQVFRNKIRILGLVFKICS
jgi:hypothetical protein